MSLTVQVFSKGYSFLWNTELVMLPAFPSNKFSSQGMTALNSHDLLLLVPCKVREKTQQSAQCCSATARSENPSDLPSLQSWFMLYIKKIPEQTWCCLSDILHIHQSAPLTILDL